MQLYVSVVSSCQLITQSRNWRWHLPGSDADLWRLSNAMYFNVILCIGIQTMPREAVTTTDNVRFWLLFMSTDNWFWFHISTCPQNGDSWLITSHIFSSEDSCLRTRSCFQAWVCALNPGSYTSAWRVAIYLAFSYPYSRLSLFTCCNRQKLSEA